MSNQHKLYAILGGGGSGKDTVRKMLVQNHPDRFISAISHTTRPMRSEETGSEYYFIDVETFQAMYERAEFIETREYVVASNEVWFYGYTVEEIERCLKQGNIVMIVDLDGFKVFKEVFDEKCVGIYLDVHRDIRIQRYLNRDEITFEMVEESVRRVKDDDDRAFVGVLDWVDYCIQPINSPTAMKQILKIVEKMEGE